MKELNLEEINEVSGGLGWSDGGVAIISLGFAGGPATGAFGLLVGGACLIVGYYAN
ncbi:hypothetical protein [Dyella sp. EPa41]|uniref:hypothetical protein n=1 Tax=Dyella sp. EPa41 TaxID=1561194 RepID=UPI00191582BA|nr:hypothetical protein [Dyella sp. EPa41]